MVFREAVRKADVLDTGYLSESLMNKLAANTGAVPACEQQFFLAMTMCSRNHHGDLNHEDFNDCLKITLGYSKLSFEARLENNTAIKEMHSALARADVRFSGLLPEGTIRRIGVEYGVHKVSLWGRKERVACLPACLPACLSFCLPVCLFVCLTSHSPNQSNSSIHP